MGGRVYDPIHDVFQESRASSTGSTAVSHESNESAGAKSNISTTSTTQNEISSVPLSSTNTATLQSINIIDDDDDDDDDGDGDGDDNDGPPIQSDDNRVNEEEEAKEKKRKRNKNNKKNSIQSIIGRDSTSDSIHDTTNIIHAKKKSSKESSRYNRHLKKPDGDYFTRSDLQYDFWKAVLNDEREIFTNIFKEYYLNSLVPLRDVYDDSGNVKVLNVTDNDADNEDYDARRFFSHDKLTFSQLYVLCLTTSNKCSKILRDKLLLDNQVAFSTCLLALLVNIGRLNTTINFYLEMTSQLRTFHAVPSLQLKTTDPKALQDTPRLKSILKNLPIGNGNIVLNELYDGRELKSDMKSHYNVINMIFALCENSIVVNETFLNPDYILYDNINVPKEDVSLFTLFDKPEFDVKDRSNVLLWLLYIHLETDLSVESIEKSLKMFGKRDENGSGYHIKLAKNTSNNVDIDSRQEISFGKIQKLKRKEFLSNMKHDGQEKETDDNHGNSTIVEENMLTPEKQPAFKSTSIKLENILSPSMDDITIPREKINNKKVEKKTTRRRRTKNSTITKDEGNDVGDNTIIVESMNRGKNATPLNTPTPTKAVTPVKANTSDARLERIDELIKIDQDKFITGDETQSELLQELKKAHEPMKLKRKELGLVKLFNDYEDIPLAPMIGIRGKKRKKYRDGLLSLETDYLVSFKKSKKVILSNLGKDKNLIKNSGIQTDTFRL